MAATPTYRIGPSDFFLPSDLAADAQTLDGQVNELDTQIEGNEGIDQTLSDQWTAFHAEWKGFYADHFGGFFSNFLTALNDSNRDQLIQFERSFQNFYAEFQKYNVGLAGGAVAPSTGTQDTLGAHVADQIDPAKAGGLATKVIVIVALIVVALLVWKKA